MAGPEAASELEGGRKSPSERKRQKQLAYVAIAVGIVGAVIAWLAYRRQAAGASSTYAPALDPQGVLASGGAMPGVDQTNYQNLAQAIEQLRGDYEDLYNRQPVDDGDTPAVDPVDASDIREWITDILRAVTPGAGQPPIGSGQNPRGATPGESNFPTPGQGGASWDPISQTSTTVDLGPADHPGKPSPSAFVISSTPASGGGYTNVVAYQGQQYTVIGAADPTRTWGQILDPGQAARQASAAAGGSGRVDGRPPRRSRADAARQRQLIAESQGRVPTISL